MPVICSSCGTENGSDQRFCGSCGASLSPACPACGTENPAGFRFCGHCGAALQATPSTVSTPPRGGAEERRWATVLFADLTGFTSRSEGMDPEDVKSMADRCTARMGEEVVRFGGTVVSVMGDAIMAVFGAPVAHEDDPERAVRAALEIRTCLASLGPGFEDLEVHVGVNTGDVMAGHVGPAERRDYTVMGDTTNTAARLMSAATSGQVLVGAETKGATEHAIRYHPIPPIEAKGKAEPVPAWAAVEAIATSAPRPVSRAPLVGRQRELSLLEEAWGHVRTDRQPHLVTVIGDAGLGKTRLATEFGERVAAAGGRALRGRSLPYGERTGYGAFAEQVREAAGLATSDPADRARTLLGRHLAGLVSDDDRGAVQAALEAILGIFEGEAGGERQSMFLQVRRYVEALARQFPTVLVFEDVHWSDPTLLDLIESLSRHGRDAPYLLLCLTRPDLLETRPAWGGGQSSATALTLATLNDAEARELVGRLLATGPGSVTLLDRLAEAAGGNPLFMEELAASISEQATDVTDAMPRTIGAIIAARLDALPPASRRVVQDASVVGKIFWRGAIQALAGSENGVAATLDDLEAHDLVRRQSESSLTGDVEYAFKHILTREVAYAAIPRSERRERHAVVARYLEDALPDRSSAATVLAHHWREAGETRRAVEYLLTAADLASRAWAQREAADLFGQAAELLGSIGDPGANEARIRRAEVLAEASAPSTEVIDDVEAMLPSIEGRDRARALLARARLAYWVPDAEGVRHFARAAAESADELGDPDLIVPAMELIAESSSMQGEVERSTTLLEAAIATATEALSDSPRLTPVYAQLALNQYWIGNFEAAVATAQLGWDGAERRGLLSPALMAGAHLGLALSGLGRHEEAVAAFERTVALGSEMEADPRLTARAANMWAGAARDAWDLDAARELSLLGRELGERASFPAATVSAGIDLLILDLLDGSLDGAKTEWRRMWEAAEATRGWHQWLWMIRLAHLRAELLLAEDRHEDALQAALEALERADRIPRPKYRIASAEAQARALLGLGRSAEALDAAADAASQAERLGQPHLLWQALATLGRARAAVGRDDEAAEAFTSARVAIESFSSGLAEPGRARLLSAGPVVEILALT